MTEVIIAQDYGAMLIGGLLAFCLSGCFNMQFIMYWRVYSCDCWRAKSLVTTTWLLDLGHSAFLAAALWDSIIVPYDNMEQLDRIPWSVGPAVQLTAMTTFLVQSFFAYRIYRLQKKRLVIVIPIITLALSRLAAASVSMAEIIRLRSYTAFMQHSFSNSMFTLGLALSAVIDVIITISLYHFLRKQRSLITNTIRILDALTLYTIWNGSVTCAAAIATLTCWSVMPQNRIFLGLHFVIAKLYANSLMATLNSRSQIRNGRHSYENDNPLPIIFPEEWGSPPVIMRKGSKRSTRRLFDDCELRTRNLKRGQSIQVNVERVVESKVDEDVGLRLESIPTRESYTLEDTSAYSCYQE